MKDKMKQKKDNKIVLYAAIFAVFAFLFLHLFFKQGVNDFTIEILAATLGASFTVAAMMVVMKIQSRDEKENEFSKRLFDKKIEMYQSILETIFRIDDDNVIDKKEIQDIENRIGETALVASSVLVSGFSQFMCQLKIYGTMYPRSMSKKQVEHFVSFFNENPNYLSFSKVKNQEPITKENFELFFISLDNLVQLIREDLSVVEGDVQEILERFVDLPIDKFKLMRNPNIVD